MTLVVTFWIVPSLCVSFSLYGIVVFDFGNAVDAAEGSALDSGSGLEVGKLFDSMADSDIGGSSGSG